MLGFRSGLSRFGGGVFSSPVALLGCPISLDFWGDPVGLERVGCVILKFWTEIRLSWDFCGDPSSATALKRSLF